MEHGPGHEGGEERALRREAYTALSGRVPVVLAVAVALLSGCVLGYGWRALLGESEADVCPVRVPPRPPPVPVEPLTTGAPPGLRFLAEKPLAPPCPSAEPADDPIKAAAAAPLP